MLRVELLLAEATIVRLLAFMSPWPILLKKALVEELTSFDIWEYKAYETQLKAGLQRAALGRLAKMFNTLDDLETSRHLARVGDPWLEDSLCDAHGWNKGTLEMVQRGDDNALTVYCRMERYGMPLDRIIWARHHRKCIKHIQLNKY
jgi:hypothetical protein